MIPTEINPHFANLHSRVPALPTDPGVYVMKDQAGTVIYIGKARSLRDRVRTYFGGGDGRAQIPALMERVAELDTIVTLSERQAFILERDMIARYKPRYNIKLKDDKAYLSIRLDPNAQWPRVELVRKVQNDGARYFGPYTFSYELRTLLDIIRRTVPLRSCSDTVFYNRQRPCLEYQIKRCCGPCCLPVPPEQYREFVAQAEAILDGRTAQLVKDLNVKMERASSELRFEDAATYRDRLEVLQGVREGQQFVSSGGEDRDVFALHREERLAVLIVLRVRGGRVSDSSTYQFQELEVSDDEVIEGAISQYYESQREIPPEIVLAVKLENIEMIAESLQSRAGHVVECVVPQRGVRARVLSLAQLNAKQQYATRFNSEARYQEIARDAATTFGLRQIPRRIECIDISNLQGSDIVGALVVFFDGEPDKKSYRKYKITAQGKPDDFASVYEVVTRRLRQATEEDDLPDLLVIDGGPGQLREAHRARDEAGIALDIISLAKMRTYRDPFALDLKGVPERVYCSADGEPIPLIEGAALTRFMSRLRDETHRFVITFHRTARSKRVFRSVLDDILGVGPERRARLFKHFGSVTQIAAANVEEIAKVGRMPLALAEKIVRAVSVSAASKPSADE